MWLHYVTMTPIKPKKTPGYQVIHTNNGVQYVYECISTSFNKQVCIGKNAPDGTFIPNARYRERHKLTPSGEKIVITSKVVGAINALEAVAVTSGLERCLATSLGKKRGAQALAHAQYLLVRGTVLSHFSSWTASHKLPDGATALSSQETSTFLSSLTVDDTEKFSSNWAVQFTSDDTLCMDLTSVSSYSQCNELVKYGFNRDQEQLEQVNILGLFSASKMLPVACPGTLRM